LIDEVKDTVTPKQREKLDQLEDELGLPRGTLPMISESDGYVFTILSD
jgi:hypothetical protein